MGQVLLGEEVLQRPRDLVSRVDLAGAQTFLQVLDSQIQVDDLIGPLEETIRNRLANHHAGHASDQIVEAVQVLHIECGDDVDTGIEQLEHVLVALFVVTARYVGVGQLVDQGHRGIAL